MKTGKQRKNKRKLKFAFFFPIEKMWDGQKILDMRKIARRYMWTLGMTGKNGKRKLKRGYIQRPTRETGKGDTIHVPIRKP